jgi:iron complex outermembrane recepter protein
VNYLTVGLILKYSNMKKILNLIIFVLFSLENYSQVDTVSYPDTIFLEETIIRAYKANRLTPITFKNLTKTEIDLVNIGQEPSAILNLTPSINSYSDAGNYQGYSYFRLRGIDQTRINMTLDGIPLNEPEDQGAYFSNYPDFFNSIQSLQIQRGVGTSSNGVASYAGSINFQTPNPISDYYTEVGATSGSFNTYRIYSEYNSGIKKNKALYARISNLSSDGYKYHSGNKSSSAFLSFGLFKTKHKFKITGFAGNQRNQLAWIGVSMDKINREPRTNGNLNENDHFFQSLISLQHTYTLNSNININSTFYYNFLKGNYDFDLNNFLGLSSTNEMYNYDFKHNFVGIFTNINWHFNKLKINSGIHINTYNRRHIGSEKTLNQLYENKGIKNELNSFIKITYTLNKFVMFGDIQYRYTDFNYNGSVSFEKIKWNFINPKVGLNYFLTENANIYYSFGTSGREPTRNDLFNGEDNLSVNSLGNSNLLKIHAEYVYNHELGIKTQTKRLYLATNIYWMNFKNEIVLNGQYGPNGLPLHSSVAKSYRCGIELDLRLKIGENFYYTNNSSLSYNRISEDNIKFQPILTPAVIINQVLDFENKSFHSGLTFKYQGKSFVDFENIHIVPKFYTIDFFGSYTFKSFTFRIWINNITNQTIISNGYIGSDGTPLFFVQAPINFNAGIIWKF